MSRRLRRRVNRRRFSISRNTVLRRDRQLRHSWWSANSWSYGPYVEDAPAAARRAAMHSEYRRRRR